MHVINTLLENENIGVRPNFCVLFLQFATGKRFFSKKTFQHETYVLGPFADFFLTSDFENEQNSDKKVQKITTALAKNYVDETFDKKIET